MLISFKLDRRGEVRRIVKLISLVIVLLISLHAIRDTPAEEKGRREKGKITYIVKRGDTLWDIAQIYLNDPYLWPIIWKENPYIINPDIIEVGDIIVIPSLAPVFLEAMEEEILPPATGTVVPAPPPPPEVPVVVPTPPVVPPIAEEKAPIPPAEGTMPLPQADATLPVPPAEGTLPLPPAEATIPLPAIEVTLPVLPKGEIFSVPAPAERKREYVGMDKCRSCHATQYTQWSETIHAKWRPSFTTPEKAKEAKITCETCHGPGSLHVEDNKERLFITSYGHLSKDTREEQNAVCIKCHSKSGLYYWYGGVHGGNLRCVDCHRVMENVSKRNLLNRTSEREICLKCHIQKKGKIFGSPHLSQDEGKMRCSTCHNPHGSDTPGLLTATSINENCYRCHAEKRGPYLFDHLPVQENCLLCHDPHSSANRALLKVRQPFLCLECHTNLPRTLPSNIDPHDVLNPQSRYIYNRGCTNCHPMIHGSRHPSGARLQR